MDEQAFMSETVAVALAESEGDPAIPGAAVLGKGFDIFGRYSSSSTKRAIFDFTGSGRSWKNPVNGLSYKVPANIDDPMPIGRFDGRAYHISSKSQMSQIFAAEAGLSGSYGAFSGELSAAFESESKELTEYELGIYRLWNRSYSLEVLSPTLDNVAKQVRSDPDFANIPREYQDDSRTRTLFFRFFEKYGTHFVSKVVMGSSLQYSCSIHKSQIESSSKFNANLNLEVQAVLFSAKADASVKWQSLGAQWASSRNAHISGVGPESILTSVLPKAGDSLLDEVNYWITQASQSPFPIQFELTPISTLFSGDQAAAVQTAMQAYAENRLTVTTTQANDSATGAFINLNGTPLASRPNSRERALQVLVLDDITLKPRFERTYPFPSLNLAECQAVYDRAYSEIQGLVGGPGIFAFAVAGAFRTTKYPSTAMYNLWRSIGARGALDLWWDTRSASASPALVSYALVGSYAQGADGAPESFAQGGYSGNRSSELALEVFLKPSLVGGSLRYLPR